MTGATLAPLPGPAAGSRPEEEKEAGAGTWKWLIASYYDKIGNNHYCLTGNIWQHTGDDWYSTGDYHDISS